METTIILSKMDLLTEVGIHLFGKHFNSLKDVERIVGKNLGPVYRDFMDQFILDVLHTYHNDQTTWQEIWDRIVVDGVYYDRGELYQDNLKFIVTGIKEKKPLDGDVENFLVYHILKENKLVK